MPTAFRNEQVQVLDHGYVSLVEWWGSDSAIIEAARMSTDKGFLGWGPTTSCIKCGLRQLNNGETHHGSPWHPYVSVEQMRCEHVAETKPGDEKLLRYLWEHKHATPFEMAGMVIEVKAPIFVFREWHRHRTQSYNEMSARYTPLPDENYIPTVERLMLNSKTNKQAGTVKGAEELTTMAAEHFQKHLVEMYAHQQTLYEWALKMGVPKELARIHLPVGRYSKMRASANLRNWLAFLTLRMDPAAQWEIRQYANEVGKLIEEKYPRTWALFIEGKS
jgi:thymidylate synthase (FAD)